MTVTHLHHAKVAPLQRKRAGGELATLEPVAQRALVQVLGMLAELARVHRPPREATRARDAERAQREAAVAVEGERAHPRIRELEPVADTCQEQRSASPSSPESRKCRPK